MDQLIDTYLQRLGFQHRPEPTRAALEALVAAHLFVVPFENLDVFDRRPIVLVTRALVEKIVLRRRGGFCFEVNEAFRALLEALGFRVHRIEAQVWIDTDQRFGAAFDHLALVVSIGTDEFLVDVGFGDSSRRPMRLPSDTSSDVSGDYRVSTQADGSGLLERTGGGLVKTLYRFTGQVRTLPDFEEMCAYHQQSPDSVFTRGLICTLPTAEGRITLTGTKFIEQSAGRRVETSVTDEDERNSILREKFGIDR